MRSTVRFSTRLPASARPPNQANSRLICSGLAPKVVLVIRGGVGQHRELSGALGGGDQHHGHQQGGLEHLAPRTPRQGRGADALGQCTVHHPGRRQRPHGHDHHHDAPAHALTNPGRQRHACHRGHGPAHEHEGDVPTPVRRRAHEAHHSRSLRREHRRRQDRERTNRPQPFIRGRHGAQRKAQRIPSHRPAEQASSINLGDGTGQQRRPTPIITAPMAISSPPLLTVMFRSRVRSLRTPPMAITPQPMMKLPNSKAHNALLMALRGKARSSSTATTQSQCGTRRASGLTMFVGWPAMKFSRLSKAVLNRPS